MTKCKVCGSITEEVFTATVMGRYSVRYYCCQTCSFMQTEDPYWLEEAYESPINLYDTGIVRRNLVLSRITSAILLFLLHKEARCLDYAGGFGIYTRLMRDLGFDFHWQDPYAENLVARGFEYSADMGPVELLTSFESFEHFVEPMSQVRRMLEISENILFSSMVVPMPIPKPEEWWYYGLEHGQHVSFYSLRTWKYIANTMELGFCTNGRNLHFLTRKKISNLRFGLVAAIGFLCGDVLASICMKSRTIKDMEYLRSDRLDASQHT